MATSDATNKFYCLLPMSKVFQVWPKRIKRSNGTVLTPDMGSDGNDLAAHHHPILQWSQGTARSLYAHLRLRLQEGVLLSK